MRTQQGRPAISRERPTNTFSQWDIRILHGYNDSLKQHFITVFGISENPVFKVFEVVG
jgi:hypothetical protein